MPYRDLTNSGKARKESFRIRRAFFIWVIVFTLGLARSSAFGMTSEARRPVAGIVAAPRFASKSPSLEAKFSTLGVIGDGQPGLNIRERLDNLGDHRRDCHRPHLTARRLNIPCDRSTPKVLNIVTPGGTGGRGLFPDGLQGPIHSYFLPAHEDDCFFGWIAVVGGSRPGFRPPPQSQTIAEDFDAPLLGTQLGRIRLGLIRHDLALG